MNRRYVVVAISKFSTIASAIVMFFARTQILKLRAFTPSAAYFSLELPEPKLTFQKSRFSREHMIRSHVDQGISPQQLLDNSHGTSITVGLEQIGALNAPETSHHYVQRFFTSITGASRDEYVGTLRHHHVSWRSCPEMISARSLSKRSRATQPRGRQRREAHQTSLLPV